MLYAEMARGARKIVEQCLGIKPGEKVLIVTDTGRDLSLATALAAAVEGAGAEFAVIITKPVAKAGDEPAAPVARAMAAADAVIAPTSRTIFHTRATREATERGGARFFSLSEATPSTLISGLIEVDYLRRKPLVDALAAKMASGKSVRITAPGGTDLRAELGGRKPEANSGICHNRGQRMGASIEVYIAPLENSAEGVFVCDASSSMIGLVPEPITIRFRRGKAVSIEGGKEARRLQEILASVGDPGAYVIAEIAFGLNPKARLVGNIIEDEGKYGTGHVALGNNIGFGGANTAPIHVDMVYWKPSAWIDEEQVFKDGELLIS